MLDTGCWARDKSDLVPTLKELQGWWGRMDNHRTVSEVLRKRQSRYFLLRTARIWKKGFQIQRCLWVWGSSNSDFVFCWGR